MPAASPDRRLVPERVLDVVLDRAPAGRARVAIDGVDGSGKTTLADELAHLLAARGCPAVRVSEDDFHHRGAVRYRLGRDSAAGFYRDSYDLERLQSDVLEPLRPGGSGRYCTRADVLLDNTDPLRPVLRRPSARA